MPSPHNSHSMLVFFLVFSLSTVARPFGSIIFGKIGDRFGRIVSVKMAAIMATLSIFGIAFIPSFESIGWFAVFLITLCRMLFLVSIAGELDAIKIYVSEKIGKKHRYFATGVVSFSSQLGVLLASFVYYITISFVDLEFLWRIGFVFGGVLGLIVILLRGRLKESKKFLNHANQTNCNSSTLFKCSNGISIIDIASINKTKFVMSVLIHGMLGGVYNFLIIFFSSFISNVAGLIELKHASANSIILIALYALACLISGYIADYVNNIIQAKIALILCILCSFIMSFDVKFTYSSYILVFIIPFYAIPCMVRMQSLFSIDIRMRMYSLSHSLGSLLFSTTTPFICMLIWQLTESIFFVMSYCLLQLIVLFCSWIYITKQNYVNMFED